MFDFAARYTLEDIDESKHRREKTSTKQDIDLKDKETIVRYRLRSRFEIIVIRGIVTTSRLSEDEDFQFSNTTIANRISQRRNYSRLSEPIRSTNFHHIVKIST